MAYGHFGNFLTECVAIRFNHILEIGFNFDSVMRHAIGKWKIERWTPMAYGTSLQGQRIDSAIAIQWP